MRAEDREAQERIFDLKRIVRTNGRIRAVVEHAINERDVVTISRCVDGADFDRQEYVRACNLLQGYMNRHSDETVITDNSQEEFDPDPEAYYVDVETLAGTVRGVRWSSFASRRWRLGASGPWVVFILILGRFGRLHNTAQRRHGALRGLRREPGRISRQTTDTRCGRRFREPARAYGIKLGVCVRSGQSRGTTLNARRRPETQI